MLHFHREIFFKNTKDIVIVSVIGKSVHHDCNKLVAFDKLERLPHVINHSPEEGQIQFFYKPHSPMLILHAETSYDHQIMLHMLQEEYENFEVFQCRVRSHFARIFLLLLHVSHIIVFVEQGFHFDASLVSLFCSVKNIRDAHILKFVPKLLKNTTAGSYLGKCARLCAPRFLVLFENYPQDHDKEKDVKSQLSYDAEDNIYESFLQEGIITNENSTTLFAIPNNKQFVFYNLNNELREDIMEQSKKLFDNMIEKLSTEEWDNEDILIKYEPFKGFARPYIAPPEDFIDIEARKSEADTKMENSFLHFLEQHVDDALSNAFDDGVHKQTNKFHFEIMPAATWYDIFTIMHKIFLDNPYNPDYVANDVDYKNYLLHFDDFFNADLCFFEECAENALNKSFDAYKESIPQMYNSKTHNEHLETAFEVFNDHSRGPYADEYRLKLRSQCDDYWSQNRQQCEKLSVRGFPCILAKHLPHDEHNSGQAFISTCNCGRTQGRRNDTYSLREANYEFFEYMSKSCNLCIKVKKIIFDVFKPSCNEYRAAEFDKDFSIFTKDLEEANEYKFSETQLSHEEFNDDYGMNALSQPTYVDFSAGISFQMQDLKLDEENENNNDDDVTADNEDEIDDDADDSDDAYCIDNVDENVTNEVGYSVSTKEYILRIRSRNVDDKDDTSVSSMQRQASTTEYLPGLIHISNEGLLPLFPSWSLVCVGNSSIYSHNQGLMEHFQSGFLSGANYLLPWDVNVRMQHAQIMNSKKRYRKQGNLIVLKVFVGYEYECPRGHRFFMSEPNKVLHGNAEIERDSGSKVVQNRMPLYYLCPCQSQQSIAQLMRIHIVTPKAPVNVLLDPKVQCGSFTFTLGLPTPPRLTQCAYWILRLPYVYQGDNVVMHPPTELLEKDILEYGCMLPGMFGIAEVDEYSDICYLRN